MQDDLSGADIKAACTEAGLLALRERRMRVTQADFKKAKEKVLYRKTGALLCLTLAADTVTPAASMARLSAAQGLCWWTDQP